MSALDVGAVVLALDTLAIVTLAIGLMLANREIERLKQAVAGLARLGAED